MTTPRPTSPDDPLRHRPRGSGHPYRIDPDQRHPHQPVAGDDVEVRVLADAAIADVVLELETPSGLSRTTTRTAMRQVPADELYPLAGTGGDGHLSAASGARPDVGTAVVFVASYRAPAGPHRYRFVAARATSDLTTPWYDVDGGRWLPSGGDLVIEGPDVVAVRRMEWLVTERGPVRCRVTLPLEPDDHVVGLGERYHALDHRWHQLDARVFEQYKRQGVRTYLPSPFALVTSDGGRAWGFHVETSRATEFDFGRTLGDQLVITVEMDPTEPTVSIRLYGGAPREIVAAHVESVGGLARPPDWVFRPWMSGNEWNSQQRVLAEVQRSIDLDIPVGVVVVEAWSDEATFVAFNDAEYEPVPDGAPRRLADYTFPADGRWPDPVAMVDRLHELGVRVLLWQIPIVPVGVDRDVSPTAARQVRFDAETLVDRRWCVQGEDGGPYHNRGWWFPGGLLPDWTDPEARRWWTDKRRYLVDEVGVDGFKTDGGEHAWGDELRYADGTRGDVSNNLFANQYPAAYHDLLRDCGRDGITFSRAGFTGAGRYPCHWAGDEDSTWAAFRASITAGLSAAVSGVAFWGWDIAGFSGEIPSVELWARATAMAALCPIMQYHAEYNHGRLPSNDRTPWNLAERHGDDRAITIYRRYAHLRERLQPYIAEQADLAVATGLPLMRPLCLDEHDHAIWRFPYQYTFGDHLLVAPVCFEGARRVEVYLPGGEWVDVWTGEGRSGGRTVTVETPIDHLPLFARAERADELLPLCAGTR